MFRWLRARRARPRAEDGTRGAWPEPASEPIASDGPSAADAASETPGAEDEPFVVPIEDALDLHHFHPSEILDIVDAYLEAAQEKGLREVRLIHGRGKGVQRMRVQSLLSRDARVIELRDAPPQRGGWGATLVTLAPAEPAGPREDGE